MEIASFLASYILSVLTLIGLIVAIVFYFQQNRILQNKSRIDNSFQLYAFLEKSGYFNDLQSFCHEVYAFPDKYWDKQGSVCHKIETIARLYYCNALDNNLFDSQFKSGLILVGEWIFKKSVALNYDGESNNPFIRPYSNFYKYWSQHNSGDK